jgi:hypothetical protein
VKHDLFPALRHGAGLLKGNGFMAERGTPPPASGEGLLGLPPALGRSPAPRFDDPPEWFQDYATQAGQLLGVADARRFVEQALDHGLSVYVSKLQMLDCFDDQPGDDASYVALWAAFELCHPSKPVYEPKSVVPHNVFSRIKRDIKRFAVHFPDPCKKLLDAAMERVRRDLARTGVRLTYVTRSMGREADQQPDVALRDQIDERIAGFPAHSPRSGAELIVDADRVYAVLRVPGKTDVRFDSLEDQIARWLAVLATSPGRWFTPSDLEAANNELAGIRTDRLKNRLPSKLRRLVESKAGKGTRLNLSLA